MTPTPKTGKIRVTILGSGTCVPSLTRSACAVLVETADTRMVLDCGPGTMRRLLEAGVGIHEVTHLFFSHFHPDHTGEMATFLFAGKYAPGPRRTHPMVMAGGTGFAGFYEAFKGVYGEWIEWADDLLVIEEFDTTGPDTRNHDGFFLTTRPVPHRPESIAFRLEAGGVSVVYSGDTDVSDSLITLAKNADLMICESALPDGWKADGHLTPSLAGEMAQKAGVRRLVLTHIYPMCDTVDIVSQCRSAYDGTVQVAEDLMRIEVP